MLANILATLVLPLAIEPPNLWRFVAGHILAVGASGLFAASSVLAIEESTRSPRSTVLSPDLACAPGIDDDRSADAAMPLSCFR